MADSIFRRGSVKRQLSMLSGLDCLPGQQDLLDVDGCSALPPEPITSEERDELEQATGLTMREPAKFYDHAANSPPAIGSAMANVRREAIAEGQAYRVEANWKGQGRFYWNGGHYDVLGLAKTLVFNRAENVVMTRPNGTQMTAEAIKAAKY